MSLPIKNFVVIVISMSKLCGPPVYAYTCTFWYSNFFCCEDFETLKILPSLPSIATIIEGNKSKIKPLKPFVTGYSGKLHQNLDR